ncbi:alpha/beta hydrolase family protein [Kribbella sp. NPDC049227]|uniref:alpha/beta hydrolase family protein n=1 Tax=Kribbella sp. NPDC049227 TaxID=3364113 RepID=UPI0037154725
MSLVSRRTVLALAAGGAAAIAVPQAAQARSAARSAPFRLTLPEPTGRYPIGTTALHLTDAARKDPWTSAARRELMVSVWYPAFPVGPRAPYAPPGSAGPLAEDVSGVLGLPAGSIDYAGTPTHAHADAPALGRHPVILYSPGAGTSRILGTHHVEDLASRGYVVVTIDHTGEAPVEFPGGRVAPVVADSNNPRRTVAVRVADIRFVLDSLADLAESEDAPDRLGRALDLRRIGMFGYSQGGFAAAETMLQDHRIKAGVNLDGTLQYGFPDGDLSESAQQGIDRPFLLFGAQGHAHVPNPESPLNDPSWTSFWNARSGWKLDLEIPAGTHGSFADYQFSVPAIAARFGLPPEQIAGHLGTVDPAVSIRAQRAYLGAFFDQFLRNQPQPLLRHPSPKYPQIVFHP